MSDGASRLGHEPPRRRPPPPPLRRVRLFVFGIPLLLGVSGLAYAYFTSQGGGAGAAATGSLAIPVMNTATPGAGTVTLTWGAVPPPATGSVSYFVTANGGTPPGGTCGTSGSPIAATTCTVTGLSAGSNSFTVTAAWNSFTSTSAPPTTVTLTSGAATKLAFSTQPTVGQNIQATGTGTFSASVSVQDANGNTVTTATNAVTLAIGTNPSAGVLACTNTGGLTVDRGLGRGHLHRLLHHQGRHRLHPGRHLEPGPDPAGQRQCLQHHRRDGQPARLHHPAGRKRRRGNQLHHLPGRLGGGLQRQRRDL